MRRVLLNAKSDFSLLWGVRRPHEVVARAAELGYEAVAVADRDNLYGLPAVLRAARRSGIRPIVAAEVTDPTTSQTVLLYPLNETGYGHLCRILTERHGAVDELDDADTGGQAAGVTRWEFRLERSLAQHGGGLAIVTGAVDILKRLRAEGHDQVYLWMAHRLTRSGPEIRDLPMAIVPPAVFFDADDMELHRLMRAVELKGRLSAVPDEACADASSLFESWDAMAGRFAALPEALEGTERLVDALGFEPDFSEVLFPSFPCPPGMSEVELLRCKTYEGARRRYGGGQDGNPAGPGCEMEITHEKPMVLRTPRGYENREAPPSLGTAFVSGTAEAMGRPVAFSGQRETHRHGSAGSSLSRSSEAAPTASGAASLPPVVVERIEYELDLIERKGFSGYFLTVDEIVQRSPRICGRGSAAASIVAYCLGITNVDPIRHNLFFERFLNPGRIDPPDIDVDFAWDERDEVLDWVLNHYGTDRAAMVANHLHFRPRMALRETARVFGLPEGEISEVTHRLPWFWQTDVEENLDEIVRTAPKLAGVQLDPPWPDIIRLASRLIGRPRGLSVHCGGVVLAPGPLWHRVPMQPAAKGVNIVQWEKDGVEELGLVKIDLLGNRSLAVIRDAIANLRDEGRPLDERTWDPIADPPTQQMLASGRTMGVFYCESPAMRQLQIKTGRGDFDHLVINTSIIRPAANAYTSLYVERVHGVPFEPIHPLLADILDETYGVMVYQEDVSRVAMAMAGFSSEDADRLRKIMSKKDRELELAHFYKQFVEGARARGVSDEAVDEIFKMILAFSGYSFCKPHSASYTMVSYESAYLKAHHPAEFMAGVMANHGGYYTTQAYVSEARRLGVEVLRPDVNLSEPGFVARGGRIVTGLGEIKGLSLAAQERLIEERRRGGPYAGLDDLLRRTEIGYADARKLVLAGALDRVESGANRPEMLWRLRVRKGASDPTSPGARSRKAGKRRADDRPLLAMLEQAAPVVPTPELRDYDEQKVLELEHEVLGFLCTAHPLEVFRPTAACGPAGDRGGAPWIKANELREHVGRTVRILSWPVSAKTITTTTGEHMEFVSFEDETALYEAVLFPRPYRRFANLLFCDFPVTVTGEVDEDYGALSLIVRHIERA